MFVELTGDKYDKDDPQAYNLDHFYTLETGREQVQVRVSEGVKRSISRLVEDPRFIHYQTSADFLRDAIVHRMHYWLEQVKDPKVRAELERILDDDQQKAYWVKRGKARLEAGTAATEIILMMKDAIQTGEWLESGARERIALFMAGHAHLLTGGQFTDIYMLRLYFMTDPMDLFNGEPFEGDEDWAPRYLREWELRQKFWPNHDPEKPILVDEVLESGVDIRAIKRLYS